MQNKKIDIVKQYINYSPFFLADDTRVKDRNDILF